MTAMPIAQLCRADGHNVILLCFRKVILNNEEKPLRSL